MYLKKLKNYKIYVLLSVMAIATILGFIGYNNATYAVILGDETIGHIKHNEISEINNMVSESRKHIENELSKKTQMEKPITYKLKLGLDNKPDAINVVKYKLEHELKFNVDAFSIKVNDKEIVHLLDKDKAVETLKNVKELYSAQYEDEEIEDIAFMENVVIEETTTNAENILSANSAYYYLITNDDSIKRYLIHEENRFTYDEINYIEDIKSKYIKNSTGELYVGSSDVDKNFMVASRGIGSQTINSKEEKKVIPKSVLDTLVVQGKPILNVQVIKTYTEEESIPYKTIYKNTNTLNKGQSKVDIKGEKGKKELTYKATFVNGVEKEKELIEEKQVKDPVDKVILKGTKVPTAYGIFIKPTTGIITSPYGPRGSGFHSGIDIASSYGTSVKAADGGKVTFAGYKGAYGYLVIINHGNGYETYYAHNSKLYVKSGQSVARGQLISAMGSTGNSTGNHLHFEIRKYGSTRNPASYVRF